MATETIVIGAGAAGLTAAYQISKLTLDVALFEAADCVGGLARSIQLWGQTVDLGPHRFFSKDRRVNELWLEVVGRDYFMVNRQTRILYQGKLFQYPLEAFDALAKLGPIEAARCLGSYAREWLAPASRNGSFEGWVCHRFGKRLFELFFKTYSEKLWGIPCDELDADFAAQRIKKFSLSEAVKGALVPGRRKQHRTLADEFAYPLGGTGMVYERMAAAIRQRGGEVRLNTPVKKVLTEDCALTPSLSHGTGESGPSFPLPSRKVVGVELSSAETLACDHVISTMPLTTLVRQLDGVPPEVLDACRQLTFRNTILVYLEVLGQNPFPDNWIYVHSPELRFGRVTNFRNWRPPTRLHEAHGSLERTSPPDMLQSRWNTARPDSEESAILAMEYWCDAEEEFWRWEDGKLSALAREEIVSSRLLRHPDQLGRSFVFRIPKCYPVYRRGYQRHLRLIKDFLGTISGLQVIGRYGAFKYNNQDHSILMGRLAAENVLRRKTHDLWGINTDYDDYQESCSITDTGLVASPATA